MSDKPSSSPPPRFSGLLLDKFDYAHYRAQQHLDFATAFCPPKDATDQLRDAVRPRMSVRRRKKMRPSEVNNTEADPESDQYGSVPDDRALASQFTVDQSNWTSSSANSSDLEVNPLRTTVY
ncbi:hypothetical protein FBUS_05978 [Fasciolopsis buskii]|uniref:Uncharacterized protein n=1 Tax=Fasciolopsis buskii TaxID=27845 RepID=A0A8E0S6W1_9TREM|nr:hypothetical protein FBUS_05978 [Fasciolopsis buski]